MDTQYTYDRSAALALALVADAKLAGCRYVPLAEAPAEQQRVAGLVVRPRMPLQAEKWERHAGR